MDMVLMACATGLWQPEQVLRRKNARVWIFFRNFASVLPFRLADDNAWNGAQYEYYYE